MSLSFTNQSLSPDELPTLEAIEFHALETAYLKVERITVLITLSVILTAGVSMTLIFSSVMDTMMVVGASVIFLLFAILLFVSTELSFKYSGYALREKDVIYRSGWIVRKERIVMLNRIQHVSIQSGPLERKFGLSSVSLYTAGASDADFTIRGIKTETAQQIKDWVSKKLNDDIS